MRNRNIRVKLTRAKVERLNSETPKRIQSERKMRLSVPCRVDGAEGGVGLRCVVVAGTLLRLTLGIQEEL